MLLNSLNKLETKANVKGKIRKHTNQQRTRGLKAVTVIKVNVKS